MLKAYLKDIRTVNFVLPKNENDVVNVNIPAQV